MSFRTASVIVVLLFLAYPTPLTVMLLPSTLLRSVTK